MSRAERFCAVLVFVSAMGAAFTAGAGEKRLYAVVIGNDQSLDKGVSPLSYADDDAAKYFELFKAMGARVALFAVLDPDAQKRFPAAAEASKPPRRRDVLRAVDRFFGRIEADKEDGRETHFYFVYSGHGNIGPNREGYINLLDARFRRSELYKEVIARSPADWNHLLLDACHSYFLVKKRGAKPDSQGDYRDVVKDFMRNEDLEHYPNVGVILAASSESETHEWSKWESGIFSHELRSAMLGAADVNRDGKVTYKEAASCVEAANAAVEDPKARLKVFFRPPPARVDLALVDLSLLKAKPVLEFPKGMEGRFHIQDSRGVRVADLHPSGEQNVGVHLLGKAPFFLRIRGMEAMVPESRAKVAVQDLTMRKYTASSKGSVEQSFRRHLYELPFGLGFFRGLTAAVQGAGPASGPRPDTAADAGTRIPPAQPPSGGEKLAVLDLTASGVDRSLAYNLSEVMADAAGRAGTYSVLSMTDIERLLAFEGEKQKLGCESDVSCLAELGGALGVDKLLTGSVGKIGSTYQVTLKLLDIVRADVLDRRTETVKGDESNLIDAVRLMTTVMLAGAGSGKGMLSLVVSVPGAAIMVDHRSVGYAPLSKPIELAPGKHRVTVQAPGYEPFAKDAVVPSGDSVDLVVALEPVAKPGGGMSLSTWGYVSLGVAAALGAGGAAAGVLARQSHDEFMKADDQNRALDLKDETDARALAANVLLGTAGTAAAAAMVLLIMDWVSDEAPSAGAAVLPSAGGALVTGVLAW
ncbi:MAG: PEGA domain-containing protein [Deltaproteobacteria bacterium]|nr:PEGA domain-containing protein [Deltaproteobacteria bacterium]